MGDRFKSISDDHLLEHGHASLTAAYSADTAHYHPLMDQTTRSQEVMKVALREGERDEDG